MRVLNDTNPRAAAKIMHYLSKALESTGLKASNTSAQIINGEEEGMLGWITANYLRNSFATAKTSQNGSKPLLGALDWGGASSQITFITNSSNASRNVRLFGKEHKLYTASHICYGQAEALKRYFVQLIYESFRANGKFMIKLSAPCQPRDGKQSFKIADLFDGPCTTYKDVKFREAVKSLKNDTVFVFKGSSDHDACRSDIKVQFDAQKCKETYEEEHCLEAKDIPMPAHDTS